MTACYDLFLDRTRPGTWPAVFSEKFGRITAVDREQDGPAMWWQAVAEAKLRRRHLVALSASLAPDQALLAGLIAAFAIDPMFGTAQPRFAKAGTGWIWPLPSDAGPVALVPRTGLEMLAPLTITAEMLAACIVIRREVVAAMDPLDGFCSLGGAILSALCIARRRGFRNAVVNRTVLETDQPGTVLYPALAAKDAALLTLRYPDHALAARANAALEEAELELLLAAAYPEPGVPRRLLMDCRGLDPIHNGTSRYLLGMLDGFAQLRPDWEIVLQVAPEAAAFHQLATRCPSFPQVNGDITRHYAAAVLLHQPWSLETVAELHRHGFLILFSMLDTIGWDILYPTPPTVEPAWRFAARHADVLAYISAFSQDRFRQRFPVSAGVKEGVVRLSLLPQEYRHGEQADLTEGEHVLIMGNDYDHKALGPTAALLCAAFPFQAFVSLGGSGPPAVNLRVVPGGAMPDAELQALVASARAVVFPSFIEGFGLPVVEGLSYGRPVLVRQSPLWREIAAHARFEAPLIAYEDEIELIEQLDAVLAGRAASGLAFGGSLSLGESAAGWRDAAAGLLGLLEARLQARDIEHWRSRSGALRIWRGRA